MPRTTKWVVAGLAAGAVVVIAGGLGAGPAVSQVSDDDELIGTTRDKAVAAALKATGGGTVTETELGDEGAAYGVEIRLPEGREVEVNLDRDLNVIGQEADDDSVGESEVDDD
jgi:hypothetical protein